MFNGRRQPSRGGTSRMTREYQVRICERLRVKFPGPTRQALRVICRWAGREVRFGQKTDLIPMPNPVDMLRAAAIFKSGHQTTPCPTSRAGFARLGPCKGGGR